MTGHDEWHAGASQIEDLEDILGLAAGPEARALARRSYEAVLVRAAEIALLCNPEVISLLRTPDVYLGRERTEVQRIVRGIVADNLVDSLVETFVSLIRGRVAHHVSKQPVELVLEQLLRRHYAYGASELRCRNCGYHFMSRDMGVARQELMAELSVNLAQTTPPERFRDPWKKADDAARKLTVDHIIPEAALGPTIADNIQVLCGYCNRRKQIYRTHLEVFGARVGAALLTLVGGPRGQWAIEAAVYFALAEYGACGEVSCDRDTQTAELTAVPVTQDRRWTGIAPWLLQVRCYEHFEDV